MRLTVEAASTLNSKLLRRIDRLLLTNQLGLCTKCSPHLGCNRTRKKARPDKYKDQRKGK